MMNKVKKTVGIVVAVLMFFTLFAGVANAENPPDNANNPFAPGYAVSAVKINNIYNSSTPLIPTFTYPANFLVRDGDCVWMLAEYDENKPNGDVIPHYTLIKVNTKNGNIVDRYDLDGRIGYRSGIYQDKYNYYLFSIKEKGDNDTITIYTFDKIMKHVVWNRSFSNCNILLYKNNDAYDIYVAYPDTDSSNNSIVIEKINHNGNTVEKRNFDIGISSLLSNDVFYNMSYIDSANNTIILAIYKNKRTANPKDYNKYWHLTNLLELNMSDGSVKQYSFTVKGNIVPADNLSYLDTFGNTNVDISRGKIPILIEPNLQHGLPDYATVGYLEKTDKGFVIDEVKKIYPRPVPGAMFNFVSDQQWWRTLVLKDGDFLFEDEPIPYHTKQDIVLYDKDYNLKWKIQTSELNLKNYPNKVVAFSINHQVFFHNMLVYVDKGKLNFADINSGVPKYTFNIPLDTDYLKKVAKTNEVGILIMPIGGDNQNFYVSVNYMEQNKDPSKNTNEAVLVKIQWQEAHLTVNSNIPGVNVTLSNGSKKFTVQSGESVALMPGTYTVSLPPAATGSFITPKPITVTLGNGDSKTVSLNYRKKYVVKLTINSNTFYVNDTAETLDSPPVIIPEWGRTVVPIRAIVEALGGTISWNPENREVDIALGDKTVSLWIGKNQAKVGWMFEQIDKDPDVKPIIINGRTMLPLRFVAESLGCTVDWDPVTRTITLTYVGN